ncbi:MAG: RHS repeat-associated core domain-containing protein [Nitrosomonas sp.]|nr:RHS repeat-associated core domain-containing protein [Nitrosomonas sp.]
MHADHLNTPRVIVDQTNTIVWRWDNTHAFGANLPNEDPEGNGQLFEYSPRFPGQYFDKETGLHYNYFRYYEPETGRYISPDPIGLAGGINVWGYVKGDPINLIDLLGLFFDSVKYASWMNEHAHLTSQHRCARYVRKGLEAGGADTRGHPISAKDYAPILIKNGFIPVPSQNYIPEIGDTVIFQPYSGGSQHGHIQTFTGNRWVSDFLQNNFYPGRGYQNSSYQIYRAPDCECYEH